MAVVTAAKIIIPVNTKGADKANKSLSALDNNFKSIDKTLQGQNKSTTAATKTSQKLTQQQKALEKQTAKTKTGYSSLTKVMGAAGLIAVFHGLSRAIQENNRLFAVQEKAEAKLEAVVRATGGAAGFTAEQMKKQAAALQQVTTMGDEVILGGQAIIATFKSISGDVFKRTTETALDLSAAFGQDLKSSAVQLGKALEDPVKGVSALARIGVTFSESEKKVIKALTETNRLAEAQGIILDTLESQVGGTARALANTASGQIQQFNNAWGDVRENLGRATTTIKAAAVPGMKDLAKSLNDATREGSSFDKLIKSVAKSINVAVQQLAFFVDTLSAGSEVFSVAINTESLEAVDEVYDSLIKQAKSLGGEQGLKGFTVLIQQGNKDAIELNKKLETARGITNKLADENKSSFGAIDKITKKIAKESTDNLKTLEKSTGKQKGFTGAIGKTADELQEAAENYRDALSILAETGDISAQLKDLEASFAEQKTIVKNAGLDTTSLIQFQLKQRESLFADYFENIASDQNVSIDDREAALNVGLKNALAAEKTTAKDRVAIQAAFNAESERLNQEWVKDLAASFELYGGMVTQAVEIGQGITDFLNNQSLQEIEDLKAVDAQRTENAEKQEALLEKNIEDLKAAGATAAAIAAAEMALDDASTANAEAKSTRDKELADKDLALRKKQAKQQKIFGIFTTLTDTAIAVTKALATIPPPAGFIVAGLAGTAGAAQTAAIANTPIPGAQFGADVTVPPGNPADGALLRVSQGEDISVKPARKSGSNFPEKVVLMVDGRQMDAYLVDGMNKNLNNGKVQSRRPGVVKAS